MHAAPTSRGWQSQTRPVSRLHLPSPLVREAVDAPGRDRRVVAAGHEAAALQADKAGADLGGGHAAGGADLDGGRLPAALEEGEDRGLGRGVHGSGVFGVPAALQGSVILPDDPLQRRALDRTMR